MLPHKDDRIIGKKVRIKSCEAEEHTGNHGCVCRHIGQIVVIERRYETPLVGTPSYHILGMNKTVRRSEVVLLKNQL